MLNPTIRSLLLRRRPLHSSALHPSFPPPSTSISGRRLLSTAPPAQRHRSWKNVLLRWGIAGGIIYYYNTSSYFADAIHAEGDKAARFIQEKTAEKVAEGEEKGMAALDRLLSSNRTQDVSDKASPDARIASKSDASTKAQQSKPSSEPAPSSDSSPSPASVEGLSDLPPSSSSDPTSDSPSPSEDDSDSQAGAFNPETGEINWDCPCLGGMAHGSCGDEFKEAFSCFVHSTEDPKGMDCIDKFKNMQDCFRKYPDEYPTEEEEEEVEKELEDGGIVAKEGDDLREEALPTAKDKAEEGKKVQKAVASPSPKE